MLLPGLLLQHHLCALGTLFYWIDFHLGWGLIKLKFFVFAWEGQMFGSGCCLAKFQGHECETKGEYPFFNVIRENKLIHFTQKPILAGGLPQLHFHLLFPEEIMLMSTWLTIVWRFKTMKVFHVGTNSCTRLDSRDSRLFFSACSWKVAKLNSCWEDWNGSVSLLEHTVSKWLVTAIFLCWHKKCMSWILFWAGLIQS